MTFLPAPPNSGVRFRRVDLEGMPEVEAGIENVSATTRSTSLSRGNVKIQTVEHVLAAFAGRGIDNAVVELDANEPPIGDGSARPYMKMIQAAGVAAQDEPREVFRVQSPICLERGETTLTVFPHDGFKITCTSADARRALHAVLHRGSDAGNAGSASWATRGRSVFLRRSRR